MTQHLYNSCEVGEAAEVCILLKLISEYAVIRLVASLNGLKLSLSSLVLCILSSGLLSVVVALAVQHEHIEKSTRRSKSKYP